MDFKLKYLDLQLRTRFNWSLPPNKYRNQVGPTKVSDKSCDETNETTVHQIYQMSIFNFYACPVWTEKLKLP